MVEPSSVLTAFGLRVCNSINQDYIIIDKMGEGNASVFVVTHKIFKEWGECAMKSQKCSESAIKEALIQKRLRHKHIVETLDVFVAADRQENK